MISARFIDGSEASTIRGFTLIEVLVVAAIMVALSAIAIPVYLFIEGRNSRHDVDYHDNN